MRILAFFFKLYGTAVGLYISSLYSYLLFHSLAEGLSIAVACGIFMIAWNSRRFIQNNYLFFLGLAYLFIAGLDLAHTLAYKGMGVFPGITGNTATQLWIGARYMESLSLLLAPLYLNRRLKLSLVLWAYILFSLLILATVFAWPIFPVCFVEGTGLTPFKKISEYIISLILTAAIVLLFKKREHFDRRVFQMMVGSILLTIGAELAFTFYVSVYGLSNLIGHFFKIASFYLIYRALIVTGLKEPYALLFRELKKEQEALRISQNRLVEMFEHLDSGVAVYEPLDNGEDFIIKDINAAGQRISRVNKKDVVGRRVTEIFPGIIEFGLFDVFQQVYRTGRAEAVPVGQYLDQRISHWSQNYVFKLPSGEVVAVYEDVTERIRYEDSLRESEAKFRTLFNSAGDAIFIHDLEGGMLEVNDAACTRLGYAYEEITALTLQDIDAPDQARLAEERIKSLSERQEMVFETKHLTKEGGIIPTEVSSKLIDFQGRPAVLSIARDITDRVRAERELKESEQKFHNMIAANVDGVLILDEQGVVRFINPAGEALFGRSADQFVGRHFGFPVLEGETTVIQIIRGQGEVVHAEIRVAKIQWEGKPAYMASLRDVTERIRAEQEKARLEEQLLQSHKLEAIGTLAGGIAHDFNNMLTAIGGFADIISFEAEASPSIKESTEIIREQVRRAARLVQQILDFSRRKHGDKQPLEMTSFLKETYKLLKRTIPENIEIVQKGVGQINWIEADPVGIQQIITNLAINARDAMPEGGRLVLELSRLKIEADQPRPFPNMSSGDWLVLTVSDTGWGIPEENLSKIFDPFFTTKEVGAGSGLGLSQVFGLVDQHGGYVDVRSRVGEGTDVSVFLPLLEHKEQNQPEEPVKEASGGQGETILLVEDEKQVLLVGQQMLKSLGYQVLVAHNGLEALQVFQENQHRISLILTDLVMPKMGGNELFKKIKEIDPQAKIMIWTGYSKKEKGRALAVDGLAGWIQKPVSQEKLGAKIREALDRKDRRDPALDNSINHE